MTGLTRALGLALALSLPACTLSALTPAARFSDAAYELNDSARWGQLDLASHHVDARYKPQFRARREGWGESVQIAETELVQLTLGEGNESALSEVSLSWMDGAGVSLRKSVLVQRWKRERGHFRLIAEEVKRGDPGIFGP